MKTPAELQRPWLAKVDGLRNLRRRDQKFPVTILENRIEDTADSGHNHARKYTCYWCKEPVSGIQRESVEILVANGECFDKQRVDVHAYCQIEREKQMALIPFSSRLLAIAVP